MRLLIVGDSHCRDISPALKALNTDNLIFTISVGSHIPSITLNYRSKLQAVTNFRPDLVVIHLGHNDISWHATKNPRPIVSRDASALTIGLANEIKANHPNVNVIISSVFPRTFAAKSLLSKAAVHKYNETAKRHGQRLHTRASEAGHVCLYTKALWSKISAAIENPSYYLLDGLHLNPSGNIAIAKEWLNEILRVQALSAQH
jgi:lysophospholipase L1-like esterase